jgi:hypothetical protein
LTKRVQLAGGITEIEAFLVGLDRELRVDQDNDSLRLHDGVKEGGYEFLNRDANDGRYQFHSAELDGFTFGAQEKGILVRVGPASYKIRKLISSDGDIAFTNFRGTAGDFDLNLAETIDTAHTWTVAQTFVERIVAEDGLAGDTYGLHHGDVLGNVTGNLEGDFNGNGTGTFTGDVDVRGHDILFDDGQIPEAALDPSILVNRGVPQGAILMWSGTIDTIPESWALCDGDNGTPDLRGRFIKGAGSGAGFSAPGASGGSATVSLSGAIAAGGSHTHPLAIDGHALTVAELPEHHHSNGVADGGGGPAFNHGTVAAVPDPSDHMVTNRGSSAGVEGNTSDTGAGDEHTHTGDTTDSGSHTHDLTLDDVTVIPPYYALCYIMKTL